LEPYRDAPWYLLVIISVVFAPFFEEAFHRGWLLTGLRARNSTRTAILLSSIAYALFHLNPWQAIMAFPLGLLFGWLVVQTGSLWPSILGHASANAAGEIVDQVLRAMGYGSEGIASMRLLPPPILIAAGVLVVVGWFLLKLAVRRSRQPA
jgi:membrane protease YdiL (CAAX protease family)